MATNIRKILRILKHNLKKALFTREPKRYRHLFNIIQNYKCRRIMEIGTWNGNHAAKMIEKAKKYWLPEEIEYYGLIYLRTLIKK